VHLCDVMHIARYIVSGVQYTRHTCGQAAMHRTSRSSTNWLVGHAPGDLE
jgi:hypothetical protein